MMFKPVNSETKKQSSRSQNTNTGIPETLKQTAEQLSGYSFDDVHVHYASDEPKKLGAYAFTQGNDIYLGSGNDRFLAHELGHVIQQKQGRVGVTSIQQKALINDDSALEKEADTLLQQSPHTYTPRYGNETTLRVIQRAPIKITMKDNTMEAYGYSGDSNTETNMQKNLVLYQAFKQHVTSLPINDDGSLRSPYQCAEPSALARLAAKHADEGSAFDLTTAKFTDEAYNPNPRQALTEEEKATPVPIGYMAPCAVCRQWVDAGRLTIKRDFLHYTFPDRFKREYHDEIKGLDLYPEHDLTEEVYKNRLLFLRGKSEQLNAVRDKINKDRRYPQMTYDQLHVLLNSFTNIKSAENAVKKAKDNMDTILSILNPGRTIALPPPRYDFWCNHVTLLEKMNNELCFREEDVVNGVLEEIGKLKFSDYDRIQKNIAETISPDPDKKTPAHKFFEYKELATFMHETEIPEQLKSLMKKKDGLYLPESVINLRDYILPAYRTLQQAFPTLSENDRIRLLQKIKVLAQTKENLHTYLQQELEACKNEETDEYDLDVLNANLSPKLAILKQQRQSVKDDKPNQDSP